VVEGREMKANYYRRGRRREAAWAAVRLLSITVALLLGAVASPSHPGHTQYRHIDVSFHAEKLLQTIDPA